MLSMTILVQVYATHETREKLKGHVLGFISNLAIIPTLVGKSTLELVRLIKDVLLEFYIISAFARFEGMNVLCF